jgi:hypothetical protein
MATCHDSDNSTVLEVIEHRYDANDDYSIRVYHTLRPEVL